ncbi:MAG: hypothetical protein J1E39_08285, partial [Eubacterium sp.]|nr:hypothetical protein [Eubacterium sp.]
MGDMAFVFSFVGRRDVVLVRLKKLHFNFDRVDYKHCKNEIAHCAMKSEQVRMKSADADEIK